jgi:hypothetical protein
MQGLQEWCHAERTPPAASPCRGLGQQPQRRQEDALRSRFARYSLGLR